MSKLEQQRALPRRRPFKLIDLTRSDSTGPPVFKVLRNPRKAKKAKKP